MPTTYTFKTKNTNKGTTGLVFNQAGVNVYAIDINWVCNETHVETRKVAARCCRETIHELKQMDSFAGRR